MNLVGAFWFRLFFFFVEFSSFLFFFFLLEMLKIKG